MALKQHILIYLALGMTGLSLVSCFPEIETFNALDQYNKDVQIIEDYIIDHQLDNAYNIDSSGIFLSFNEEGTEDTLLHPLLDNANSSTNQYISVAYKGYLPDGTVFDETEEGDTVEFLLDNMIWGWKISFLEMSKGDKATLLIPSYFGYGNQAIGNIPANSVLLFDVTLFDFEQR